MDLSAAGNGRYSFEEEMEHFERMICSKWHSTRLEENLEKHQGRNQRGDDQKQHIVVKVGGISLQGGVSGSGLLHRLRLVF